MNTSSAARHALLVLCLAASAAFAKPKIELAIAQAKEVVEIKNGTRTVTLVPVKEAASGDIVEYTLSYSNTGDEQAKDAVIDDPIPKGSTYVSDSAAGEGSEISFSTDGGKTFAPATKLTYEVKTPQGQVERKAATPTDYTHVRFTVKSIAPGASGKVRFRVRLN
ncbi:MAG: DUF11 domain-containing protein [Deltaproteobacteria bacterium]|nr:DUF11 domain-containing protein [Deltaproteobacteria bacterium]